MNKLFVLCCLYLSLSSSAKCQTLNLHSFWNNVSFRFQTEMMTPGMRSFLYGIAEKETKRYSETLALLETLSSNPKLQERIFLMTYLEQYANKESIRIIFANMCGSFSLGNPVADYICLKYSKDADAKLLLLKYREVRKEQQKERKVQEEPINTEEKIDSVKIVETEVLFPGGQEAVNKILGKNIHIPDSAVANDIHGQVVVEFFIDTAGKVQNAKVTSPHLGYGLEEEALRVVYLLPLFIPATKNGMPIMASWKQSFSF